jgi:ribosomal protein L40E
LEAGLNPEWLSGPGCFPSFIAAFINEAYQDKAGYERTRLFLAALTWEDKQAEYQAWLGEQQAAAERSRKCEETEAERQRVATLRLATPKPVSCLNCGAGLPPDTDLCPKCDHYSRWDDESGAYTAQKRFDFSELTREFRKKHRISNDNVPAGDMAQYFREIP